MLVYPHIDPVIFRIGPLAVHWYGVMYLVAFVLFVWLARLRVRQRPPVPGFSYRDIEDMLFYGVLGVILGGRLGYVLFYKPAYYWAHPFEIPAVWEGGMSFHGGFLGVLAAMWLYARRRRIPWIALADFVAPLVPLGLFAGRMGNFINGELVGRPTSLPWGMLFPSDPTHPRHPSQLYEAGLEGLVLFVLLWTVSRKPRPPGMIAALFLLGYGCARFAVEFTRAPDDFLGLLSLGLTMGQWLSLPMIAAGAILLAWSLRGSVRRAGAPLNEPR